MAEEIIKDIEQYIGTKEVENERKAGAANLAVHVKEFEDRMQQNSVLEVCNEAASSIDVEIKRSNERLRYPYIQRESPKDFND